MKRERKKIRRIRKSVEKQYKKLYRIGRRAENRLDELSCDEFTDPDGQSLYRFVGTLEIACSQSEAIIKSLLSAEMGKGV